MIVLGSGEAQAGAVRRGPTTDFRNRLELGRRLFATTIDIAPPRRTPVTYRYEVPDVLTSDGYRLLIQNQATPWPDEFSVDASIPASAVSGLREGFGRGASLDWSGPLVAEKELRPRWMCLGTRGCWPRSPRSFAAPQ